MTPTEERLKILQMLEDDKISAEEASTLLRAMEGGQRAAATPASVGPDNRFLHVHVTDLVSGADKVNVTIPMGLVWVGLRMAERFAPEFEDFDRAELEELIASGVTGKLVEVTDAQDNERVEIYVE